MRAVNLMFCYKPPLLWVKFDFDRHMCRYAAARQYHSLPSERQIFKVVVYVPIDWFHKVVQNIWSARTEGIKNNDIPTILNMSSHRTNICHTDLMGEGSIKDEITHMSDDRSVRVRGATPAFWVPSWAWNFILLHILYNTVHNTVSSTRLIQYCNTVLISAMCLL